VFSLKLWQMMTMSIFPIDAHVTIAIADTFSASILFFVFNAMGRQLNGRGESEDLPFNQ